MKRSFLFLLQLIFVWRDETCDIFALSSVYVPSDEQSVLCVNRLLPFTDPEFIEYCIIQIKIVMNREMYLFMSLVTSAFWGKFTDRRERPLST